MTITVLKTTSEIVILVLNQCLYLFNMFDNGNYDILLTRMKMPICTSVFCYLFVK